MKTALKNILIGISLGSALFAITGIVFDIIFAGNFQLANWQYTKMALGSMLVGIGFSVPSVVYNNDKMSLGMQTLIHMGIGCTVMLAVAFAVGWIPLAAGWPACVLAVLGELLVAFLIWLGFALHYKRMAKRMNDKLDKMRGQ
ncbi:MAG: DUF3021 domain-containing protein [Candidatus Limiplasma sp.]|nr:DUF3021 domain-containing protein [Candidatus Limiplasma sp.]